MQTSHSLLHKFKLMLWHLNYEDSEAIPEGNHLNQMGLLQFKMYYMYNFIHLIPITINTAVIAVHTLIGTGSNTPLIDSFQLSYK